MAHVIDFKKQWWVSFAVIFGSIAVAAGGLYYLSGAVGAQSAEIVADRNVVVEQATVVANLAQLKNDAVLAEPYLAAMQKLLPTHDALIGLPQWIAALAQTHGVTASFAFSGDKTPPTATSPGRDSFSLAVTGTSDNIVSFLNDLETTAPGYLVSISSFDLTSTGGQNFILSTQGQAFSQ